MERLTKRNIDGSVGVSKLRYYNYDDFQKITQKLAEYEDAEEQGLLFKLPCKIGDEFFVIAYSSNVITHVKCTGYVIQEDTANKIKGCHIWLDSIENPRDYWKLSFDDFKIQCFATKEQAEQALKEMEGNR